MNTCWICGNEANSSEHKIKHSDIIQSYGKQNYQNIPEYPVHYANGYLWRQVTNYLVINFFYLAHPEGEKGYPWIADNQFLYLGSIETFTQEEWNDIIFVAKKLEENG